MGDLGFLQWKDPLEWTEKGAEKAYRDENRRFAEELKGFPLKSFKLDNFDSIKRGPVEIRPKGRGYEYKIKKWSYCEAIDYYKGELYIIVDVGNGSQDYRLSKVGGWTYEAAVGPEFGIHEGRIYCLEAESPLRYTRLISLSLDGTNRILHYSERNSGIALSLERAGGLFLRGYNSGLQTLQVIGGGTFPGNYFYPVSEKIYFSKNLNSWKTNGPWKLNSEITSSGIEFASLNPPCIITKRAGLRTFWTLGDGVPKKVFTSVGTHVRPVLLACDSYKCPETIQWTSCGKTPQRLNLRGVLSPSETYAECSYIEKKEYAYALLDTKSPKGLLIIAYATYNIPLSMDTSRWRPWIEAGWLVAFAFLKGGGDGNEADAQAARDNRYRLLQEYDACIQDIQGKTGISAKCTCVYGRSAGGLLIGGITALYPNGERVGMVYGEVPYVDILKSASNPELPLTPYEYKEIADPRKSPADFYKTLQISPIHMLSGGAPGVKVLCRAGMNDKQTYPYEVLKWILTLRCKNDRTKILATDSHGHYTHRIKNYAEDFAIINNWLEQV